MAVLTTDTADICFTYKESHSLQTVTLINGYSRSKSDFNYYKIAHF